MALVGIDAGVWSLVPALLASSTSGSDRTVRVRTQIPYAAITELIAGALFLVLGFALPQGFEVIPY